MIRLSDILKESNIEDYPEFYQKWYKTHYDIGGKERAERYLKTLPPAKELKKRKELGDKIEAKLKEVKRKAHSEMDKKRLGSQALPQLLFKYYKEELPKFGKITDKQILTMMRKDSIKTVWDETDYLIKIFMK